MTVVSPSRPRSRPKRFEYDPVQETSVAEVLRCTPDQWIGMAVTRYNDRDEPFAGFVMSYGRIRRRVVSQLAGMNGLPEGALGVFVFFSNPASIPPSLVTG